ncbi:hypothetical protein J6590_030063 [Homalodisca vitripennis]|nr:hypothetical protein J6590_030063 [Homalodisca vitripennis]
MWEATEWDLVGRSTCPGRSHSRNHAPPLCSKLDHPPDGPYGGIWIILDILYNIFIKFYMRSSFSMSITRYSGFQEDLIKRL